MPRRIIAHAQRAQVRSYVEWRAGGFAKLTAADVANEAATGKAKLLAERDLVRLRVSRPCAVMAEDAGSQLGRPTVLVKVALNRVDTRVLAVRGRARLRLLCASADARRTGD